MHQRPIRVTQEQTCSGISPLHTHEPATFRTRLPCSLRVVRSALKGREMNAHRPLIFILLSLLEGGLSLLTPARP
jgi:hypothetical protein